MTCDIIPFAESPQQLNIMIKDLQNASIDVRLEINLDKTKVMINHSEMLITIDNTLLEFVEKYIYLSKQNRFVKKEIQKKQKEE